MDRPTRSLHYLNMISIPTYTLYGEFGSERLHGWLHWETIQSRSRLHDYRIAPHRHEHLLQVLQLMSGSARVTLDGEEFDLAPGCVVVVPALTVHGYDFSPDVEGVVVTLLDRDVRAIDLPFAEAVVIPQAPKPIAAAIERLIAEADEPGERHDVAMRAHMALLLLLLHRASSRSATGSGGADRMRQHAEAFRQLVDRQFRQTRRIADYAGQIGISHTHLNRICRRMLGASAQQVIERRVALEVRRQLQFSMLPIRQIGAELGYDDPAYFTRLATRLLGVAPSAFRRRLLGS